LTVAVNPHIKTAPLHIISKAHCIIGIGSAVGDENVFHAITPFVARIIYEINESSDVMIRSAVQAMEGHPHSY